VSLVVALLAAAGILLWPGRFSWHRLGILPGMPSAFVSVRSRSVFVSAGQQALQYLPGHHHLPGHRETGVSAPDLLGLLEAIAPALEAGIAPAAALQIAADARSGSADLDPLAALAGDVASAAAQGAPLGPLWRRAAESAGSEELLLLAQAWSLTEDLGVPLAQAVRTTAGLLEARIAHERRLAGAVAGARATVNLLTFLPVGGPLLALVPAELYGGSRLTQGSLVLGLCLAGFGRWWVHRMVGAVARGPVIACGSLS
jgi:tight adherence protein B